MQLRPLFALLPLSLALAAGPALAERDIEKVFSGITAEAGEAYGSLSTVNGGITIRDGATVDSAGTVNGGIRIGEKAEVGSAETVNGGIRVGAGSRVGSLAAVNGGLSLRAGAIVKDDAETVNGGISLEREAEVGGDVSSVNGAIRLERAKVGGRINTVNGDITVGEGSRVDGGIRVEKPNSSWWNSSNSRKPRIVIGPNAVVGGSLVFEREVELFVHASAKIGPVTGATAKRYTDRLPARD